MPRTACSARPPDIRSCCFFCLTFVSLSLLRVRSASARISWYNISSETLSKHFWIAHVSMPAPRESSVVACSALLHSPPTTPGALFPLNTGTPWPLSDMAALSLCTPISWAPRCLPGPSLHTPAANPPLVATTTALFQRLSPPPLGPQVASWVHPSFQPTASTRRTPLADSVFWDSQASVFPTVLKFTSVWGGITDFQQGHFCHG